MSYSSEVLADSPLVYLELDEASGTTAADSSGNSRDMTSANCTVNQATVMPLGTASYDFNGTSSQISLVDALWQRPSAMTVEAWIRPDAVNSFRAIGGKDASGSGWAFYIIDGKLSLYTNGTAHTTTSVYFTAGNTYHVAATYSAGAIKLYVDGAEVQSWTGQALTQNGTSLMCGVSTGSNGGAFRFFWFDGRIDEFAYYDTALSGTRISDHYTAGTTAPPTTGSFAVDLPVPTVDFAGSYVPPAESGSFAVDLPVPVADFAGTYQAPPSGSFAVDLPVPVVAFDGTYTPPVDPTGSFDITLPTPVVEFAGTYFPLETGSFAVDLPVPVVAFDGTYVPAPISGSFAVDLPLLVVEFAGLASAGVGSFAVDLPILSVAFEGTYGGPYPTDTSNDLGGIRLEGSGVATVTRPVTAPPASLVLATRVDKAAAYPTPTMVNGRPT